MQFFFGHPKEAIDQYPRLYNHLNGDNSKPNNGAEETINNYNRKNGKRAKKKLLFLTTLKG